MPRAPAAAVCVLAVFAAAARCQPAAGEPILVRNPRALPGDQLAAQRVPLGVPDDYKPCVALLPDGQLLVTAFHQHPLADGKVREDMLLFRSGDGGRTWSEAQTPNLLGREPYFTVLGDGTLLVTVHLLAHDVRNDAAVTHSYVHRSTDGGRTWATTRLAADDLPGAPPGSWVLTSRNVLVRSDGTLLLGVSAPQGVDYLWRSADGGATWDRALRCAFEGVAAEPLWWPFMAETVLWEAPGGDLLGLWRVDHRVFPRSDQPPPDERSDQYERLIVFRSRDGGATWHREPELGSDYGEMYPALLRLHDGRLLLTFTVRAVHVPLGVHAVLGEQTDDGFRFDFAHDRLVLCAKTPADQASGGGFGPTVELADGTLVTAHSYRAADGRTRLEVVRWRLP